MGRLDSEADQQDWQETEDDEAPVDLDDDFPDGDDAAAESVVLRAPRPTSAQRLMARRLIEQAREKRELSQRLADFDDYLV